VICAKHRNGATFTLDLKFSKEITKFMDGDGLVVGDYEISMQHKRVDSPPDEFPF